MGQNKNTGYALYDFMTRDMGLSGVALRVFALIYSFTAAGSDCHGSLDYIAERTQASKRMVQRALDLLVKQGYVIKEKISPNRPSIYVASIDPHGQNVHVKEKTHSHDVHVTMSKCPCDVDMMSTNNKDNYLPTNNCYIDELRPIEIGNGAVRLTFHEYASLIRAIGVEATIHYIRTLDRQITEHPERTYPNHFKTIVTWAREDYRLDSRGEEILQS